MRSVLLCIVYFIFFPGFGRSITEDSHLPCGDSSWDTYKDEKCLKLIREFRTRQEANKICYQQQLSTDTSTPELVSIESVAKQEYLNKFLFKQMQVMETVWTGAWRIWGLQIAPYVWTNSYSPLNYTNWAEGRPHFGSGHCVEMRSPSAIKYKRSIPESTISVTKGNWFNVPCKKRNLVLCEKLQTWSFKQLQKTFINLRQELTDSLEDVRKQIKNQQTTINNQQTTISSHQSTIDNLNQNPVPIGFIYVQLPRQPEPINLWPMVQWKDVTSDYAGLFFRAEGGGSATFEQIQSENSPRLTAVNTQYNQYNVQVGVRVPLSAGETSKFIYTGASLYYSSLNQSSLTFEVSGGEVRPRNMAIRVWKRAG